MPQRAVGYHVHSLNMHTERGGDQVAIEARPKDQQSGEGRPPDYLGQLRTSGLAQFHAVGGEGEGVGGRAQSLAGPACLFAIPCTTVYQIRHSLM